MTTSKDELEQQIHALRRERDELLLRLTLLEWAAGSAWAALARRAGEARARMREASGREAATPPD